MAFTVNELTQHKHAVESFLNQRRPPEHIRIELDIGCEIDRQSVEVFEIRPHWEDNTTKTRTPSAKTTFVRSNGEWKVYWMRSDGKWHAYGPRPTVKSLTAFLTLVHQDECHCFFG